MELLRQRGQHVVTAGQAQRDSRLAEANATLALVREHALDVVGREAARFGNDRTDRAVMDVARVPYERCITGIEVL